MAREVMSFGSLKNFHVYDSANHSPLKITQSAAAGNVLTSDGVGNFDPGTTEDAGLPTAPGGLTTNVLPKTLLGSALTLTDSSITDTGSLVTVANPLTVTGLVNSQGGRIVNVTLVTSTPYTILATDHDIHVDTDAAAIAANLPAGVEGTQYRIVNVGSSGNDVTVAPNGAEHLLGANSSFTLLDGESLILVYHATEGWY